MLILPVVEFDYMMIPMDTSMPQTPSSIFLAPWPEWEFLSTHFKVAKFEKLWFEGRENAIKPSAIFKIASVIWEICLPVKNKQTKRKQKRRYTGVTESILESSVRWQEVTLLLIN